MGQPAVYLPDDLPLQPEALDQIDGGRLRPLISALTKQLAQWQALDDKTRRLHSPPRLGLFGGLGQGKSSVLLAVKQRLQQPQAPQTIRMRWQRWQQLLFGPAVVHFDVSYFKADDLEWRFLTAVLWRRILMNALWMLPALVMLVVLALGGYIIGKEWAFGSWLQMHWLVAMRWVWGTAQVHWWWVLPLGVPLAVVGVRIHKAYGKVNFGAGLFVSQRDLLTQGLARFFSALPSVVLVDDLDRARVEQQRAFLRAMMRFSDRMGFALVVSLDETELLTSPANPEMPQELLRKTIHHEYRVPDRGPEDIALLAVLTAEDFAQRNLIAHPTLATQLRQASWMADWVRVLLLLPPPLSPRMVKRLLADTLVAASLRPNQGWRHLVPLLRLQALYFLAPALRNYAHEFCGVLEANRAAGFVLLLEKCHPGDSEKLRRANATAFFRRTRMMQPVHGEGWFDLVMGMPSKHSSEGQDAGNTLQNSTTLIVKSFDWRFANKGETTVSEQVVPMLRLFRESIQHAASGYETPLFALQFEFVQGNQTNIQPAWPQSASVIPWGRSPQNKWVFASSTLPEGWLSDTTSNFTQHTPFLSATFWLCWVSAMVAADVAMRDEIYRAATTWIKTRVNAGELAFFEHALLRERGADEEFWSRMQPSERAALAEQAAQHADLVTLLPLGAADFHLAVKYLPKTARDERALARWLQPVGYDLLYRSKHGLLDEVVASVTGLPTSGDLAAVWPTVIFEAGTPDDWCKVLNSHLQMWSALSMASPAVPMTVINALVRAWPILSPVQKLSLFETLACPGGKIEAETFLIRLSAWVKALGEMAPTSTYFESEIGPFGSADWMKNLTPNQRLVVFVCHLLKDGELQADSVSFLGKDGVDLLGTVALAVFSADSIQKSVRGVTSTQAGWVVKSSLCFWITLLKMWDLKLNVNDPVYVLVRQVLQLRQDSNEIFDAIGWAANAPSF